MTRSSYRVWCGVIGRVLPKPAALMREALNETLPVRIATGEIRAYLPVSSDEGMAAGSGTSLGLVQLRLRLQYLGCVSNGDTAVLHKAIDIAWWLCDKNRIRGPLAHWRTVGNIGHYDTQTSSELMLTCQLNPYSRSWGDVTRSNPAYCSRVSSQLFHLNHV